MCRDRGLHTPRAQHTNGRRNSSSAGGAGRAAIPLPAQASVAPGPERHQRCAFVARRARVTPAARDGSAALLPPPHNHASRKQQKGIALPGLARLLWRHWRDVDWRLYWHRVAFLGVMAAVNSALGALDWCVCVVLDVCRVCVYGLQCTPLCLRCTQCTLNQPPTNHPQKTHTIKRLRFRRAVSAQELHPEPLIILGHPRTGTTHVHNLLALDPAFCHATTFHAGVMSGLCCLVPQGGGGEALAIITNSITNNKQQHYHPNKRLPRLLHQPRPLQEPVLAAAERDAADGRDGAVVGDARGACVARCVGVFVLLVAGELRRRPHNKRHTKHKTQPTQTTPPPKN